MTGRHFRHAGPCRLLSIGLLVALVLPSWLQAGEAEKENPLRDPSTYLPESTVLFVQVAPWEEWARDWKKTSLAKIAQDPEMRAFLAGPFGKLEELIREAFAGKGAAPRKKDEPGAQPSTVASFFEILSAIAPGPAVVALAYTEEDAAAKRPPGMIMVLGTKDPTRFSKLAEAFCNLLLNQHVKQQQYGSATMFAVKYKSIDFGLILLKDHIVISTRSGLAKQVIDGIAGTAPRKLADNPNYQACRLSKTAHNTVFLDMAALSKMAGLKDRKAEKNVLDAIGLADIRTIGWSMRMNGPAFETSAAVVSGQRRSGWLSSLDNESISTDALKAIRPGCPYAVGLRVRQDRLLSVVEEALRRSLSGEEFARFVAVKEKVGAAKLTADMARAFGTELVLTALSGRDGTPVGALSTDLGSLKLRDAGKAEALLADLMKRVAAERGDGTNPEDALRRIEYEGAKVMYLTPPRSFSGLTPVIALSGDRLLAALDMQTLKAAIRSQKTSGLASDKAFKLALEGVGGDLGSLFVYLDYTQLYAKSYGFFATGIKLLGSVLPLQQAGVDINLLPTPESLGRHLFPALVVVSTTEKGISIKSRGPLPSPEVIIPPVAAAAAVVASFAEQAHEKAPAEPEKARE